MPSGARLRSGGDGALDGEAGFDPGVGATGDVDGVVVADLLEELGDLARAAAGFADDALPDNNSDKDNDLRLWDVTTGQLLIVLEGYEHGYNSVAFTPNGEVLAATSEYGIVRRWDLKTREVQAVLEVPGVHGIALSPDGTLIATGGEILRLWGVPDH